MSGSHPGAAPRGGEIEAKGAGLPGRERHVGERRGVVAGDVDGGADGAAPPQAPVAQAPQVAQGDIGHVQVEGRPRRRLLEDRHQRGRHRRGGLPRNGVVAPADGHGQAAQPEMRAGERRSHRARVHGGAAHVDAVVDPRQHDVGPGPEPAHAGEDHGQGREARRCRRWACRRGPRWRGPRSRRRRGSARARRRLRTRCSRSWGRRPRRRGPWRRRRRASAAMPGARTPSSLVTSIRTDPPGGWPTTLRRRRRILRRRGLVRLPYDSATDPYAADDRTRATPLPVTATGTPAPSGVQYDIGHGRHQVVVPRWAPPSAPTPSGARRSSTDSASTPCATRAGGRCSPRGPTAWATAATATTDATARPPSTNPPPQRHPRAGALDGVARGVARPERPHPRLHAAPAARIPVAARARQSSTAWDATG